MSKIGGVRGSPMGEVQGARLRRVCFGSPWFCCGGAKSRSVAVRFVAAARENDVR
jgi:hypothetical protein